MAIKLLHKPPAVSDTERPVPRWATRLAYALPLLLLPSCLWRLPFAVHFTMGQIHEVGMPSYWLTIPYVLTLSVLSEVIALLTIGLVRGWGEVAPPWVPVVGGRRVRPLAATVPAVVGGLILTVLFFAIPLGDGQAFTLYGGVIDTIGYTHAAWQALATICTSPISLWGPLTIVLALAYHRRRTRTRTRTQLPCPRPDMSRVRRATRHAPQGRSGRPDAAARRVPRPRPRLVHRRRSILLGQRTVCESRRPCGPRRCCPAGAVRRASGAERWRCGGRACPSAPGHGAAVDLLLGMSPQSHTGGADEHAVHHRQRRYPGRE